MIEIRVLTLNDLTIAEAHMAEHARENGTDGDVHFMPYDRSYPLVASAFIEKRRKSWAAQMGGAEPWERMWGLFEGGALCGHVDLHQGGLSTMSHRVTLGLGLRRSHRGRRLGRRLTETAIGWAKLQPTLSWLDLNVFAANTRALRLYQALGFQELGRTPDLFRLDGVSIDDVAMTLPLRGQALR